MGTHRADRSARHDRSATAAATGRHRVTDHSAPRASRGRGLPSTPLVGGLFLLAIAVGGVVTEGEPAAVTASRASASLSGAGISVSDSVGGSSGIGRVEQLAKREAAVSRDSRREALKDAADEKKLEVAEAQARQRNAALAQFAQQAEQQAKKIAQNTWTLPVKGYRITNEFGVARSYYASGYHTGLDFAVATGTPIRAVANGTITTASYSGAYGNKTVQTLEDGTEIWYCHQTEFAVQPGQKVASGEVIGYVGTTGNSSGPHLHLEVRPGAGDPVDPDEALQFHGVKP